MKKIIFCFLFLCSCGGMDFMGGGSQVNECNFRVQYGFVVRWNELPVPIYVHHSVPEQARKNLIYAVDMWNESWNYHSGSGTLFEVMGNVAQAMPDKHGDGVNVFYMDRQKLFYPRSSRKNDPNVHVLNNERHGVTRLKASFGGALFDGDIVINNVAFDLHYEKDMEDYSYYTHVPKLSTARTLASTSQHSFWMSWLLAFQSFMDWVQKLWTQVVDRQPSAKKIAIPPKKLDSLSLFLHELGHFGALMHDEFDEANIMFPKLARGQVRRHLTEKDMHRMICGYQK